MHELREELRIEVKTSRSGAFPIGARDLDGPGPKGYVAALLNDRLLHGPRWVLVPARGLQVRGYDEKELATSAEQPELAGEINRRWSDWILDRDAWGRLLESGIPGIAERIRWCRKEHPPRQNQSVGNVREVKLTAALEAFRTRIDEVAAGESGSQPEGQVHQTLLSDVLEQLGYVVLENPVGVPDIVATHAGGAATADVQSRLNSWRPTAERLRAARNAILRLEPVELRQFLEVIRGG